MMLSWIPPGGMTSAHQISANFRNTYVGLVLGFYTERLQLDPASAAGKGKLSIT